MRNIYIPGEWNAVCDRCGLKYKGSMLRQEWQGLYVCPTCYEKKHPSLYQRVPNEDLSVEWSRPEPTDIFIDVPYITVPEVPVTPTSPEHAAAFATAVNLSGMEWAQTTVRYGTSTYPNINYTVPRASQLEYLASTGVTLVRLNLAWEFLQPTRPSTPVISSTVLAGFTSPIQATYNKGDFWEVYATAVDGVLDAAAAYGIKVILDVHNYCRYKDFVYQADGSVVGWTRPADKAYPPYSTDNTQAVNLIFSKSSSVGQVSSTTTLPFTVSTLPLGPTYTIAAGDPNGNFAISGNLVRMVNTTGVTFSPANVRTLRVTGSDASSRTFQVTLGDGSTLPQSDFNDLWTKIVNRWKNHAGLGGYGLMNEPNTMPAVGKNWPSNDYPPGYPSPDFTEDLTIWNEFAQNAVNTIRALDTETDIYVSGNGWSTCINWTTNNPNYPLTGRNLVYEFHLYLDATTGGFRFDWDDEVAKGFSAGESGGAVISSSTGPNRIQHILNWNTANGGDKRMACGEFGLPVERVSAGGALDTRWFTSGDNTLTTLKNNNIPVFSWMGGNHYALHSYPITHAPKWYQNKTVEPIVGAYMKKQLALNQATLFDEGGQWSSGGSAVTITVEARGNLTAPLTVTVASNAGGSFSKTSLTLAAGVNSKDSFTFTPVADTITTLTYTRGDGGQVPPPRKVYSLLNPVAYAATSLPDAAKAIMAKYGAACWLPQDAYKDYLGSTHAVACTAGSEIRAIANSGSGSSVESPLEAINWLNQDAGGYRGIEGPSLYNTGPGGKPGFDQRTYGRRGLISKQQIPHIDGWTSDVNYEFPASRTPYDLNTSHFSVCAFEITAAGTTGTMVAGQYTQGSQKSALQLNAGVLRLSQTNSSASTTNLVDPAGALATNTLFKVSFASTAAAQRLRKNGVVVATGAVALGSGQFDSIGIGSGYWDFFPRDGIQGWTYGWITGPGAITDAELTVLEDYLATFR